MSVEINSRRIVIIAENDALADEFCWQPTLSETLHKYLDHLDKTRGAGNTLQIFQDTNGNKLTVFFGSCLDLQSI